MEQIATHASARSADASQHSEQVLVAAERNAGLGGDVMRARAGDDRDGAFAAGALRGTLALGSSPRAARCSELFGCHAAWPSARARPNAANTLGKQLAVVRLRLGDQDPKALEQRIPAARNGA